MEIQSEDHDRIHFELLYDKYAPKVFGFIIELTKTKEQAEELLINIFLRIWYEIKSFGEDPEKKIMRIILLECKPIYKNKYLY